MTFLASGWNELNLCIRRRRRSELTLYPRSDIHCSAVVETRDARVRTPFTNLEGMEIRKRVAVEVLTTERSYVESLSALEEIYMFPVEQSGLLTEEEVAVVFNKVLAISPSNRGFLKELEALMDNWNDRSSLLGPLFIKYAPFFKVCCLPGWS